MRQREKLSGQARDLRRAAVIHGESSHFGLILAVRGGHAAPHALGVLLVALALPACGNSAGGDSNNGSGGTAIHAGGSGAGASASGDSSTTGGAATTGGGTSLAGGGSPAAAGGMANAGGNPSGGGSQAGSGGNPQAGAGGSLQAGGSGGGSALSCPMPALKSGDTTQNVMVGSANRSYVLHVPAQYDGSKAVPLVVDFHPLGGSGPAERSGSPYPAETDPEGVIMAFPSGLAGPSGGAWNVGPCCVQGADDVGFAKALVEQVKQTACIDPKRVYAVGFSMGGGMSHYIACHAADVFAAVAPAAFDLLKENVDGCQPARPITVVSFRGSADPIVPYAGGYSALVQGMPVNFLGAKGTFDKWSALNHCSGAASAEDNNGCAAYSGCQGGVDVVLCTKQGGGHEPGNAQVAWPILKKHVLP